VNLRPDRGRAIPTVLSFDEDLTRTIRWFGERPAAA
jgi:hypothetical protein